MRRIVCLFNMTGHLSKIIHTYHTNLCPLDAFFVPGVGVGADEFQIKLHDLLAAPLDSVLLVCLIIQRNKNKGTLYRFSFKTTMTTIACLVIIFLFVVTV